MLGPELIFKIPGLVLNQRIMVKGEHYSPSYAWLNRQPWIFIIFREIWNTQASREPWEIDFILKFPSICTFLQEFDKNNLL